MVTRDMTVKRVLLHLLKDFSSTHTITELASELRLTRVGIWKILKKLEEEKFILLKAIGRGKTSTFLISLNWENSLTEKTLSLYLTEEALTQRRWQINFADLEKCVQFTILYGSILHHPQEARDIDILGITNKKKFANIQVIIDNVQKTQSRDIHPIHFTEGEFKAELQKLNKAFIEAIKKGVILFGQEQFVKFMRGISK
ncbi:MAG TPA: HTH domain-containing protein [Candidatus Nanoarchaeia archaeon]|nr:HTH domain-containing protein [Candidatus Nanoarchaeia archaeon]